MADETTATTDESTTVLDTPAGDAGTQGADLAPTQATAPDAERPAHDTGDKEPGPVPYGRFKDVNSRLGAYRRLGDDPEHIAAKLQRLDQFERAARGREVDPQMDRRSVLGDTILDLLNEKLPGFTEHARGLTDQRERELDRADHEAAQHLTRLLEQHDLPVSDDTFPTHAAMVSAVIQRDPELQQQFVNPRTAGKALDTAFGRVRDHVLNPALLRAGASKLEHVASRRAQLGTRATPGSTATTGSEFNPKAKPGTPEYAAEAERAIDAIINGAG